MILVLAPAPARNGALPRIDSYGEQAIQQVLSEAGVYCTWNGLPHFKVAGTWRPYDSAHGLRSELIKLMALVSQRAGSDTPLKEWFSGNADPEESIILTIKRNSNAMLWGDWPRDFLGSLVASQERSHVNQARGILRHPIVGEPEDFWIENTRKINVPQETTYPHLRCLFSALELDSRSHLALHSFLFGCFHAVSLSAPRPILLVDSWSQGRGKSEICTAVSRLVDDNEGSIPARSGDNQEFFDCLGARFRTARTVTVDNVDGVRDFNQTLLATAASGTLALRWKYAKQEALIDGAIIMMNLVTGQATFHDDMLARMVRCELQGHPKPLFPSPQGYARENRGAIIGEIIHALKNSTPIDACSRTAAFDSVALGAYRQVFGGETQTLVGLLEGARRNCLLHCGNVLEHFFCHAPAAFGKINERVLKDPHRYNKLYADKLILPPDIEGITGFGFTHENGEWKCSTS